MKKYLAFALGNNSDPEIPIKQQVLQQVRQKVNQGNPLPLAVEEFLSIGGYINSLAIDPGSDLLETQEWAQDAMEGSDLKIEKPYLVFDQYNGCEQFHFIYLDEGEDPLVYVALPLVDDQERIESLDLRFSEYIEKKVDKRLKGQPLI